MDYCQRLPKIELHAHLNGSLSIEHMSHFVHRESPEFVAFKDALGDCNINRAFSLFDFIYKHINTTQKVAHMTRLVISEFASENVKYLELRTTPRASEMFTMMEYLQAVLDGMNHSPIIVKLIVSIDRRQSPTVQREIIDLAILFRNNGHPIVGIDLCGNPAQGYISDCIASLQYARANGFKITVHTGEIPNAAETALILELCPDRLGHATFVDAQLINIPTEICLTSNVLCQTVASYETHHFLQIDRSIVCICTDDRGIFGTSLSNEYHCLMKHYNLNKRELFSISLRALDFMFCDISKEQIVNQWTKFGEIMGFHTVDAQ
jgi:adenosine deaminase